MFLFLVIFVSEIMQKYNISNSVYPRDQIQTTITVFMKREMNANFKLQFKVFYHHRGSLQWCNYIILLLLV